MPFSKKVSKNIGASTFDEILTIEECADLLKVKPTTVYSWTRSRSRRPIPHLHLGGKFLRFKRSAVLEWLDGQPGAA